LSRILDVYFHSVLAGKLIQQTSGVLSFQYDTNYMDGKNTPPISVSMPIQNEIYEGNKVKAFFSGFLPEDIIRHRLAKYLGVSEKNPFALLEIIGGECAGAISLYREGEIPSKAQDEDVEILDNKKLAEILDLLKRRPLLVGVDDLRLSLAGAQDKLPVGLKEGNIALVKGTTPTTHILKPLIADIKDSVHNELFCMRLAKLLDIDVPETEIRWVGDSPYFLIERYDRMRNKEDMIIRLHQEDFCQALSVMPEFKYEREGGPNIEKCLDLVQKYSAQPVADHLAFIKIVIFNYLIGNADAHGKNFSLLYKDSLPILAPAYDLLSTAVIKDLSSKMAMKIGGKYEPNEVLLRHWHRLVPDTTVAKKNLEKQLFQIANICFEKAIDLKSTLMSEGIQSTVFDDICHVIKKRGERIKREIVE